MAAGAGLGRAAAELDAAIGALERAGVGGAGGGAAPPLLEDPDDPWAGRGRLPPPGVEKRRCPETGYLLTAPFEQRCPMPGAFKGDAGYLAGMLKPVLRPKESGGKVSDKGGGKGGGSKAAASPAAAAGAAGPDEEGFAKAQLQVALVKSCEPHPDSDKLYVCQIEIAGGETRQVLTGLQKHLSAADIQGKLVCTITNLKKAKLAGTPSEAMILAGESSDGGAVVKLVVPPTGSVPGDRLFLEGGAPMEATPKTLSSKIWGAIVPHLDVRGGTACFGGKKIVTAKGDVSVPMPDGSRVK